MCHAVVRTPRTACAHVATVRSEPGNPPEGRYSYAVKVWYSQCQGSYFDVFAQSGFQKP